MIASIHKKTQDYIIEIILAKLLFYLQKLKLLHFSTIVIKLSFLINEIINIA